MEDQTLLKDIKHEQHPNDPVYKWEFVQKDDIRVFFKLREEDVDGFFFFVLSSEGHVCNEQTEKDEWHQDYCFVECLFQGYGVFDGIRHLYAGDKQTDNYGYFYYPDTRQLITALKILEELEDKFCPHR